MQFSSLLEIHKSIEIIYGDHEDFELVGISHSDAPLENTFCFVKNNRFLRAIGRRSNNDEFLRSGIILDKKFFEGLPDDSKKSIETRFAWVATSESIDQAMCELSKPFYDLLHADLNYQVDGRQMGSAQIDPTAEIAQGVFIGENVSIGQNVRILPGCVIMPEVSIGDNSILYPNITIYPYTSIGHDCRIHAGTVIGTDGFGYNFYDGVHNKIWHLCGVSIGNDVEIGCNSMIDAGAFIPTTIGDGSRLDNDLQISHNVLIGKHVVICGKTGLAGSVEVSDYCGFGAGAGVAPGAKIGKRAQVAARAVVSENAEIAAGAIVAGHPARPVKDWLRSQAVLNKLSKK